MPGKFSKVLVFPAGAAALAIHCQGQPAYLTEGSMSNPKYLPYVFFNTNCPFCHYTRKALPPHGKAGLQVPGSWPARYADP